MELGIAEDFSTQVELDNQLKNPKTGVFLNEGTNPLVTTKNLLQFLSFEDFTFRVWDEGKEYGVYDNRNTDNIVSYEGIIYQSLTVNTNSKPDTNASDWMQTNSESLKLKRFMKRVEERVYSSLNLSRNLVENQYVYDSGERTDYEIPNDFAAVRIEPKNSDYVTIRINEMSLEATTDNDTVNVYVVSQGVLIDTLVLKTFQGRLEFDRLDYSFSAKGYVRFVIDKATVRKGISQVDSLKFKGFTYVNELGIGDSPESADYSKSYDGNGIGFNLSISLESSKFIDNNSKELANYFRATFEFMSFELFFTNANSRSNETSKSILNQDFLYNEITDNKGYTAAYKMISEKEKAINSIRSVFDSQLNNNNRIRVKQSSL